MFAAEEIQVLVILSAAKNLSLPVNSAQDGIHTRYVSRDTRYEVALCSFSLDGDFILVYFMP